MLKKGFVLVVLSILCLFPNTVVFAEDLTESQKDDIQTAKERTEKALKEMEKINTPIYYGDPKLSTNRISGLQFEASLASTPYWKRKGMIYVTLSSSSSGSSAWAGGHAGISYSSKYTIESFGNKGDKNGVRKWSNTWEKRYKHFYALGVGTTTLDDDKKAADKANSYIGKPYNYNFFYINQNNSFYCSQLVWYVFKHLPEHAVDLNDGGAVWPIDLKESKHTYVAYEQ
ncbi:YiiX/YebB-like N1pC/P60 family cysteine hydrolase [Caenibacillus caldisaponilyticus]|uniref:YiiX/YebB-like N1pC/P60 family cysteine hydrolase n=1 Tax=Caenibacillus caldisaponilyticus TaxID=1674942 RepID=UPI0009887A59|nr:YiiX/YebB-like N1pC/P60 family cysteine hydrolase [Caenibacillus caldisaponilyticus]